MTRPGVKALEGLMICLAASMQLVACGGGGGLVMPDAAADGRASLRDGNAQIFDTGPDLPGDRTEVRADAQPGADASSDRADGHADTSDVAPDLARDATDGPSPPDVGPDVTPDHPTGAPDLGSDHPDNADAASDLPAIADAGFDGVGDPDGASDDGAGDLCGIGCPTSVRPMALAVWLTADNGVTCDAVSSRVSGWRNRAVANQVFGPPAGHSGPMCGTHALAGKPVTYFDRMGADDLAGVLAVDLGALVGGEYTVFVVERRQSADEGYLLGTELPFSAVIDCSADQQGAYRFGYLPTPQTFVAGPYVFDNDTQDCGDPLVTPSPYSPTSPPSSLDVERFSMADGHHVYLGATEGGNDGDTTPITSLSQGYVGRAFQALDSGLRHSRFLGDVAEVVIYAASLSDNDRTAVTTYLTNRWLH